MPAGSESAEESPESVEGSVVGSAAEETERLVI